LQHLLLKTVKSSQCSQIASLRAACAPISKGKADETFLLGFLNKIGFHSNPTMDGHKEWPIENLQECAQNPVIGSNLPFVNAS